MKKIKEIKSKLKEKHSNYKLRRTNTDLKMAFFDSASMIPVQSWDQVVGDQNIYLKTAYLSALEEKMEPLGMNFRYVLFQKNKRDVAVAYFQLIDVDGDSVGIDKNEGKRKKIQGGLLERMSLRTMINGNLFCSGPNGFYFDAGLIDGQEAYQALCIAAYRIRRADKLDGTITAILAKDFFEEQYFDADTFKRYDYREFCIDPNMVVFLKQEWKTLDDYLAAMTSKYRSQYKKTMKKSSELESRYLNSKEILKHAQGIQGLFDGVHEKADFKLGHLDVEVFAEWNESLKDEFFLKAYFYQTKLVGFFSAFLNGATTLDANYVGMDYELNIEKGIYQTMLYDFVELALEKGCNRVNLGRTAGEIKSGIGAVPVEMKCYMRHQNSFSNKLIKPVFQFISPSEFSQREPFKK